MFSKKAIIISSLIAIVVVAGISITFAIILLNNTSKTNDDIYVVHGVVEMPNDISEYTPVGCWAETFVEWEFNSTKPYINLYIQLDVPGSGLKTLIWGVTTHISGYENTTGNPGTYDFRIFNLDEDHEKVNITFRLRYDNPWWQGEGTPGW